jgi:hypothetical protein
VNKPLVEALKKKRQGLSITIGIDNGQNKSTELAPPTNMYHEGEETPQDEAQNHSLEELNQAVDEKEKSLTPEDVFGKNPNNKPANTLRSKVMFGKNKK